MLQLNGSEIVQAIKDVELSTSAGLLLALVRQAYKDGADLMDHDGSEWVALRNEDYSEVTGLTYRQVSRAIRTLVAQGLIERRMVRHAPTKGIRHYIRPR